MTNYAQQILDLILTSGDHLTAEQIYLRLKESSPRVVLATVYNNLNTLHGQNLIRKISVEGYPDRYDKTTRHDHLLCRGCGVLADVCLPDLTAQLQARVDVEILSYDLKLNYLCPRCRAAEAADQTKKEEANL